MHTVADPRTARPTVHFDPTDPALIADPRSAFSRLRASTPLAWSPRR